MDKAKFGFLLIDLSILLVVIAFVVVFVKKINFRTIFNTILINQNISLTNEITQKQSP